MSTAPATAGERASIAASLLTPPLAWMTFEYGLAAALRGSCGTVGSWLGAGWGAAALVACAVAAVLAWRTAPASVGKNAPTRPWMARLALFGSGIFALAIAFQSLATLIVPSCAR